MRRIVIASLCALFVTVAVPAIQGKGHGKGKGKGGGEAIIVFHTDSRQIIVEHFRTSSSGLPPGLARRGGDLPPGLEKQLRRNGRLPPGLEKKLVAFPVDLERRLPPLPAGMRRGTIGGHAVIYDPGKGMILDVFVAF